MVVRDGGIDHRQFSNLPEYLREGDVLVLNETRVIAARVFGTRPSGGKAELLLLRPARGRYDPNATRWEVLAKPGRKLGVDREVVFGDDGRARIVAVHDEDGVREAEFELSIPFEQFLERYGDLPLPPYIHNDSAQARERYQTVFARVPGSVAAPTASLHFTPRVLDALREKGVQIVKLVLDVGLGTFRPMQGERLEQHVMHGETFEIPQSTADAIARAKADGRRVVAAGTTVVRALEGSAQRHGKVTAGVDETALFITPGFDFRAVDVLITNFHLPQSTLLVLVSAFAGRDRVLHAYRTAVEDEYRFFSFGDAMLLERSS